MALTKDKSYGYADKNWGKDFTSPWVWISSCNLYSNIHKKTLENSVFDVGGGRPKIFGISIDKKLLIELNYEGVEYEFNFSKFWMGIKTQFSCIETDTQVIWRVITSSRNSQLEIECFCNKSEMLCINYESPNGYKNHNKLWNGGTGYGKLKLYRKEKNILNNDIGKVYLLIATYSGFEGLTEYYLDNVSISYIAD